MSSNEPNVVWVSGDEETFVVPVRMAKMSSIVKRILEPGDLEDRSRPEEVEVLTENEEIKIRFPRINGATLGKVIEFCLYCDQVEEITIESMGDHQTLDEYIEPAWYLEYINLDHNLIMQIVCAAYRLKIEPLLKLAALAVLFKVIRGKSTEELRHIFRIPSPVNEHAGGNADGADDGSNADSNVDGNADGAVDANDDDYDDANADTKDDDNTDGDDNGDDDGNADSNVDGNADGAVDANADAEDDGRADGDSNGNDDGIINM